MKNAQQEGAWGACCYSDTVCLHISGATECESLGGSYVGDGLICGDDPDEDGFTNCLDGCPLDPLKTEPGLCGCGSVDESDEDSDGVRDCIDLCPGIIGRLVDALGCPTAGACCYSSGDCLEYTEFEVCYLDGGYHQGGGTACRHGCRFSGDYDDNGQLNLDDYSFWSTCATGPDSVNVEFPCALFNVRGSRSIDLLDFAAFQTIIYGSARIPDRDADGVVDSNDNCLTAPNPNQANTDADSLGDVCDNCPTVADESQSDIDGDQIGDVCDTCPTDPGNDNDNDGICAADDNCKRVYNPDQADSDGNGVGDACQVDPTGNWTATASIVQDEFGTNRHWYVAPEVYAVNRYGSLSFMEVTLDITEIRGTWGSADIEVLSTVVSIFPTPLYRVRNIYSLSPSAVLTETMQVRLFVLEFAETTVTLTFSYLVEGQVKDGDNVIIEYSGDYSGVLEGTHDGDSTIQWVSGEVTAHRCPAGQECRDETMPPDWYTGIWTRQ